MTRKYHKRDEVAELLDVYGAALSDYQREILRLWCDEGLSHAEIADRLDESMGRIVTSKNAGAARMERLEERLHLLPIFQAIEALGWQVRRGDVPKRIQDFFTVDKDGRPCLKLEEEEDG